jgi:AraC-like DNA-binding protein
MGEPFFRYVRRVPSGPAADLARESWVVEAERCRMAVEAALPDSSVELYFNLGPRGRYLTGTVAPGSLPRRAAWVVGPHERPLYVEKETRDCQIVAIRLHPWVVERALGVAAGELCGSLVDLDEFWGSAVDDISGQLHDAPGPLDRLAIVERAVVAHVARRTPRVDVELARDLCLAGDCVTHSSVASIAARHGLTHRRVIEVFDRAVGLKPKTFYRVRRLRRVLHLVHESPRPTWTAIAHRCGFFDQAHLINDFRKLTGISPMEYEATRSGVGYGFVPYRLATAEPVLQGFPIA